MISMNGFLDFLLQNNEEKQSNYYLDNKDY